MSVSTKILLAIGSVLLAVVVGLAVYEVHRIDSRQTAIENSIVQQQKLADGITRSMASWATKADLAQFAKDSGVNLDTINKNLASLNASLSAINTSSSSSTGQVATNIHSTGSTPVSVPHTNTNTTTVTCDGKQIACPNSDPYGYQLTTQQFALNEEFGTLKVPFGTVGFAASQAAPWSMNIAPRQYNSTTTVGTDANQRIYTYNTFSIHVDGKDYVIPVTSSQVKQEYPVPAFSWFNPRLYLGLDAGVNITALKGNITPDLNVQIASYGKYKTQPDLSIAQVGVGYDMVSRNPTFSLRPVSYNIGQHIPLMTNLYVGPAVQLNTQGNWSATLGLTVGL